MPWRLLTFPSCRVALCHHRRGAIHPCRGGWQIVVNGTTSVPVWGKLDCLRGYRWAGVGRFRRITPELSKVGGAPMLTPLATTLGDAQGRSIAFRSKDAQSSVVTRALTSAIS